VSRIKSKLLILILIFWLSGCVNQSQPKSCKDCHPQVFFDRFHQQLSCIQCHQGREKATSKKEAHKDLLKNPPADLVYQVCIKCHKFEVEGFKNSLHYTYRKMISHTFQAFGIPKNLSVRELNAYRFEKPFDPTSTLIDFLRRRCFLCHVDYEGEDYPKTRRAKGCLACHFRYQEKKLTGHFILKPKMDNCLACHYSSYIGWDYLGYSPHNWYEDYRAPFIKGKTPERPYGIEAYQLLRSVHYEKGMVCTDCHKKEEVMFQRQKIKCLDCHQKLSKPIHTRENLLKYRCEVCHVNFVNLDGELYCRLELNPLLEDWEGLAVQESSEVERFFSLLIKSPNLPKPLMKDKLNGELKEGLWLCGLGERTFEKIVLGRDLYGKICVLRKKRITIEYEDWELEGTLRKCVSPHSIGKGKIFGVGGF